MSDKKILREAFLSCLVILLIVCTLYAILMPTYNRTRRLIARDRQFHANTRAIENAMGFTFTAMNTGEKESWKDDGMQILSVTPGGPAARAGLQPGDKISRVRYPVIKRLIVGFRGKSLVLPVERAGRQFDCTIAVPKFVVPFVNPADSTPRS